MRCKTGGTRLSRPPADGRDKRDPPARRCRSMGHGRDKRDPPARPSRRRQREGRACRVRLRNVEHRGHPIQRHAQRAFDGARSRQARPSRAPRAFNGARSRQARPSPATIPEETNGRDALVASAYGTWNTGDIPFSATRRCRSMGHGRDKRDPPARPSRKTNGRDALVASAYGTWRPPAQPAWGTSRDPPRAKNKARREHASGRTGLAEGGGFEPPIR